MKYLPKRDNTYAFAIWHGPIVLLILLFFFFSIPLLITFAVFIIFSYWLWNSTEYMIDNGVLYIKCWFLRKKLNINEIVNVRETNNIYSSYALSCNRLEITGKFNSKYYIAPLDFNKFINELKENNPNITVS